MGCVIRAAVSRDIPSLVGLLVALFTQEADFTPDPAAHERGLRLLLAPGSNAHIFVAEVDGAVVGMVSLFTLISTALGGPATWVEDFIVAEGFRGQGIGQALMDAVKAHVAESGQRRITLLTDARNSRGHKFYETAGFTPSAMIPFRHFLK